MMAKEYNDLLTPMPEDCNRDHGESIDLTPWEEEALEAMWKERDRKAEEAYSDIESVGNSNELPLHELSNEELNSKMDEIAKDNPIWHRNERGRWDQGKDWHHWMTNMTPELSIAGKISPEDHRKLFHEYVLGDTHPSELKDVIDRVASVSEPTQSHMVSYRGLSVPRVEARYPVGKIITLPHPSSYSNLEDVAHQFSKRRYARQASSGERRAAEGKHHSRVVLETLIPKDSHIARIMPLQDTGFEHLLPSGSRLRVIHSHRKEGKLHVRTILLPHDEPTSNELSDEAQQAITEAQEASTAAKKATAWFPGRGESSIEQGKEILSPRAKAHYYAGIAYQRNRIRAFDLAARNHTLAAKAHRLAAKDSLEVALRSAHREAALAHYQAVRANKRASRLIERVGIESPTENFHSEQARKSAIANPSSAAYGGHIPIVNILYRDIHHEGEFYPVYKNPSTYQLEHILRSDPDKEVRGLIHPENGDVYVWGAAGGGLLHKHAINHYLEGELPHNSHRIFLQKLVHSEDPNETHMSVRGVVGKHVKAFAAKHGIRLNETFAENEHKSRRKK